MVKHTIQDNCEGLTKEYSRWTWEEGKERRKVLEWARSCSDPSCSWNLCKLNRGRARLQRPFHIANTLLEVSPRLMYSQCVRQKDVPPLQYQNHTEYYWYIVCKSYFYLRNVNFCCCKIYYFTQYTILNSYKNLWEKSCFVENQHHLYIYDFAVTFIL